MGQRLVVTIYDGETPLANAYYHWSGYTDSAVEITNRCIEYYQRHKDEYAFKKQLAIDMLYSTEAGLTFNAMKEAYSMMSKNPLMTIPIQRAIDRNRGLVEIEQNGMDDSQSASEGDVYIYLDSETVTFTVFWTCEESELIDDYVCEHDIDDEELTEEKENEIINEICKDLKSINYDLECIKFNEFDDFAKEMYGLSSLFMWGDYIVGKIA